MIVRRIVLRQVRNYEYLDFSPAPHVNVLFGKNAQGKTNLLESLYLCCTGRSFRPVREREILRLQGQDGVEEESAYPQAVDKTVDKTGEEVWKPCAKSKRQPWALIVIEVEKMGAKYKIEFLIQEEKRHAIRINGTPLSRIGDLMGICNCVLFSPEEMRILKDGPQERRRYMDILLSQLYPVYFFSLQRYMKALKQRNALLRSQMAPKQKTALLQALTRDMAQNGALVMQHRAYLASQMQEEAQKQHAVLAKGEQLALLYCPDVAALPQAEGEEWLSLNTRKQIAQSLYQALTENTEKEVLRATTLFGPHRDELLFLLQGQNARLYASQGQQRTFLLSLKLAEVELFSRLKGEMPLLLLDDVFSELDEERQRLLLLQAGKTQTFITTAQDHRKKIPVKDSCFYRVEKGKIQMETPSSLV